MSQKELNYIEDICNHETLILNFINDAYNYLENETFIDIINNHADIILSMNNKNIKLLEDNA